MKLKIADPNQIFLFGVDQILGVFYFRVSTLKSETKWEKETSSQEKAKSTGEHLAPTGLEESRISWQEN